MRRTGQAVLPLHGGKAPHWLLSRMKGLAREIVVIILEEHGPDEFLRRISDPCWFQSLGCVLGYDWHSSGVTTVLTGVLKSVLDPAGGVAVAGGKGRRSLRAPEEIRVIGNGFGFSGDRIADLTRSSRMSAKVDSTAIQAGYDLYHHAFFLTSEGRWAVVQQGMDGETGTARRYHWLSDSVQSFVEEPHQAIVSEERKHSVLDLTSRESRDCRRVSLDLVKDGIGRVRTDFECLARGPQRTLGEWIETGEASPVGAGPPITLVMPRSVNWSALEQAYERQPTTYEELLAQQGIGRATVRGLALVSQVIYGAAPSWKDPVEYSFAYGGKDGVPRPVDRTAMDESIAFLRDAIEEARLDRGEKLAAFRRLSDTGENR